MSSSIPVVVDLDGTLIYTDMLHELTVKMMGEAPLSLFQLPFQLRHGKAQLKQFITSKVAFKADTLPYNTELLIWLKAQKALGRKLILCTAADAQVATPIASYLGVFSEVMASDGTMNLSGDNKAKALTERFGKGKFDYCGNAAIDLKVWKVARFAVVVNASEKVLEQVNSEVSVVKVFAQYDVSLTNIIQALHLKHWIRNLLYLLPFLLAILLLAEDSQRLLSSVAFMLYGFASVAPVIRDLASLQADRDHFQLKEKPIASGQVTILCAVTFVVSSIVGIVGLVSVINTIF